MLLAGVILWSMGTLLAPPAAKISLLALCASRVFVRTPAQTLACSCCFYAAIWPVVIDNMTMACYLLTF